LAYANKKDYDHSIADYNKSISIEPTYATGYANRGLAWEKKSDLQKALADFKKAVELNPSSQAGQQGLARVKKALGQ